MEAKVHLRRNRFLAGLTLLVIPLMFSCTDGSSPSDLPTGEARAQLIFSPKLLATLASAEAPEIVVIRAVATLFGESEVVGTWQGPVDPGASSWPVDIEVTLPPGEGPEIEITVELLSASGATEWSGHIGPITVVPGQTTSAGTVTVVRGPLENLSVTAVSITGPASMRVGDNVTLQATASSSASGASPVIYWSSLDPEVGTVSESGTFLALNPGTARVVAVAGPVSDTITIQVLPALGSVVVSPSSATADALGEELAFTAQVLDTNGEPVESETVTWSADEPSVLEHLGGGVFRAVGEGTARVTATSDSDPSLSATADVSVKQVPVQVTLTPASATLTAIGETARFTAEAMDANDNPISGAVFIWSSSHGGVATVDSDGLATATGGGTAEIKAEVLGPSGAPSGVYGTAQVTVELPITVFVSPETAELMEGSVADFFAWAEDQTGSSPSGLTFSWTTSDPEIATVIPKSEIPDGHQATVEGVSPGEATITVTAAGVSASAQVTVTPGVVALRWVQQPQDGYTTMIMSPAPSVEALDASGNRVESFQGEISLYAAYLGWEPTSAQASPSQGGPPALDPEGPQLTVNGTTTVAAVNGVATFNNIYMTGQEGFYELTAQALGAAGYIYAVSASFMILGF